MSDLISRQALGETMYEEVFLKDSDEQRWDGGCWIRYKMFERVIDAMPTIDAVPVKHGEWSTYEVSGYRKCSMCGGYVNWNPKPFLFGDGEYNFCPNCGSKMREEGDNDRT